MSSSRLHEEVPSAESYLERILAGDKSARRPTFSRTARPPPRRHRRGATRPSANMGSAVSSARKLTPQPPPPRRSSNPSRHNARRKRGVVILDPQKPRAILYAQPVPRRQLDPSSPLRHGETKSHGVLRINRRQPPIRTDGRMDGWMRALGLVGLVRPPMGGQSR